MGGTTAIAQCTPIQHHVDARATRYSGRIVRLCRWPLIIALTGASVFGSVQLASAATPTLPAQSQLVQLGAALNSALAHDTSADALFFPESAYVTMKTGRIENPRLDYVDRLLAFFHLDEVAYRQIIFGRHPGATYVGVADTYSQAGFIPTGVCENGFAYWHLPRPRLVYRTTTGALFSVAINSLITFNGRWYIVHLGPNPRAHNVGTVDGFELGAGTSGPAGGC